MEPVHYGTSAVSVEQSDSSVVFGKHLTIILSAAWLLFRLVLSGEGDVRGVASSYSSEQTPRFESSLEALTSSSAASLRSQPRRRLNARVNNRRLESCLVEQGI